MDIKALAEKYESYVIEQRRGFMRIPSFLGRSSHHRRHCGTAGADGARGQAV